MPEINTTPIHTTTTFVAACRNFFGLRLGDTLPQFAAELKALTPQDKADLVEMFKTVGIDATKSN